MFLFRRRYTVPVQFRSSAGAKLYLIASTKLHRITLASVNVLLIRNFCIGSKSDLVQCKSRIIGFLITIPEVSIMLEIRQDVAIL